MPARKEIVVNLGTSHVSASVFIFSPTGIVLEQIVHRNTEHFVGEESAWIDGTGSALKSICKEFKIRGNAKIILPGSRLLSKTLRVPKVEENKQKKIVAYELEQKMPFSLSQMIWDFQVIDDDGIEQEILAFAVKPEFIIDVCRVIYECGLIPSHLCPGSILENEVLSRSKQLEGYPEKLLINVGAKSTNLLFSNSSGFLVRGINIGGNTFTENLADSFGLPFEKAEELKLNYLDNKLNLENNDQALDLLNKAKQNFFNKISQEITRSIVTYKRLKKGKSPKIVIATGRPAQNAEMIKFFSDSLEMPIVHYGINEFIEKSDSIEEEELDKFSFRNSESLGFALFIDTNKSAKGLINLLPDSMIRSLEFKKKKVWLLVGAALFALCPLPHYFSQKSIESKELLYQKQLDDLAEEKEQKLLNISLQKKTLGYHQLLNSAGFNYINQFSSLGHRLYYQPRLINDLQSLMQKEGVENIWFDSLKISPWDDPTSATMSAGKDELGLVVEGRYLVHIDDAPITEQNEERNKLIDANSIIQEILTDSISKMPQVDRLSRKVFSTEGKGDLFVRYFTHFEIEFIINLNK